MLYTEDFKKQVVKKVLSPGVLQAEVCRRLHISETSVKNWKIRYGEEVQKEIRELDIEALLREKRVDIEDLLRDAERTERAEMTGSAEVARHIDELEHSGKTIERYDDHDKYAVVMVVRALPNDRKGEFLRRHGLDDRHIRLWEEELISMSKKTIKDEEYVARLETENKQLRKDLAASERDKHELEVLIELKKKYQVLFKSGEEEK